MWNGREPESNLSQLCNRLGQTYEEFLKGPDEGSRRGGGESRMLPSQQQRCEVETEKIGDPAAQMNTDTYFSHRHCHCHQTPVGQGHTPTCIFDDDDRSHTYN